MSETSPTCGMADCQAKQGIPCKWCAFAAMKARHAVEEAPVGRVDDEGNVTWYDPIPEGGANLFAGPIDLASAEHHARALVKACQQPWREDASPDGVSAAFVATLMGYIGEHLSPRNREHLRQLIDSPEFDGPQP